MQDEESLIRRAQQHDEKAFTQLYEEHFDKIYRYIAVRIGNVTEAEDMTQQVFLNALKSISSFKWRGAPFSAWLFRIAHNQIIDYFRKNKRSTLPLNESMVSNSSNPQQETERKSDIEHLLLATRQLTDTQREVISLRFTSELPIAQVAKIMDKSEGAIKALQHSAIVALRKRLQVTRNE
ncbi:MAG: sigma-70 family RNA polymerase sigma factor [Dehalococcoidales bacterium]|nr:sigma-70 family RNA polymerase sigma factor [Dehalococcoidales bacterium]